MINVQYCPYISDFFKSKIKVDNTMTDGWQATAKAWTF